MVRRIAILLPDLGGGGAERINIELARELIDLGYHVEFVLLQRKGDLLAEVPTGATVVGLGARNAKAALWPLKRYFDEERTDVVIAHMWPITALAVIARLLARSHPRLLLVEHIDFSAPFRGYHGTKAMMRIFGRLIYQRADAVVCVSEGVKSGLVVRTRISPDRIEVIYNPVRPPSMVFPIDDPELAAWWHRSEKRILSIGRLVSQKDQASLLRAFAILRQTHDARLMILGDGPERRNLEQLVSELSLGDYVRLPGFQSDPHNYLAQASLFVMSSLWEGLPTVLIEALMHAVPIVSTDCRSGPREILAGGEFGALVPCGDAQAIGRAMADLLDQTPNREALIARSGYFAPREAALNYVRLFEEDAISGQSRNSQR